MGVFRTIAGLKKSNEKENQPPRKTQRSKRVHTNTNNTRWWRNLHRHRKGTTNRWQSKYRCNCCAGEVFPGTKKIYQNHIWNHRSIQTLHDREIMEKNFLLSIFCVMLILVSNKNTSKQKICRLNLPEQLRM